MKNCVESNGSLNLHQLSLPHRREPVPPLVLPLTVQVHFHCAEKGPLFGQFGFDPFLDGLPARVNNSLAADLFNMSSGKFNLAFDCDILMD